MNGKWLYIKNASPADGIAFASVLHTSKDKWNVVHSSSYYCFIHNLQNVNIGHPDGVKDVLIIDVNGCSTFNERCNYIASQLGLPTQSSWNAFTFYQTKDNELETRLRSYKNVILLYFIPRSCENINLIMIDQSMRILTQDNFTIVDGNSSMLPNIKGTKDYRGLIDVENILRNLFVISTVITTEKWMKEICSVYHIKCCIISGEEDLIFLDGIKIEHPLQFANYIQNFINQTN